MFIIYVVLEREIFKNILLVYFLKSIPLSSRLHAAPSSSMENSDGAM